MLEKNRNMLAVQAFINRFEFIGRISKLKLMELAVSAIPKRGLQISKTSMKIHKSWWDELKDLTKEYLKTPEGIAHTDSLTERVSRDKTIQLMQAVSNAEYNYSGIELAKALDNIVIQYQIAPIKLKPYMECDLILRSQKFYAPYKTKLEVNNANRAILNIKGRSTGQEFVINGGNFYYRGAR